jgi:hypothetical protein
MRVMSILCLSAAVIFVLAVPDLASATGKRMHHPRHHHHSHQQRHPRHALY